MTKHLQISFPQHNVNDQFLLVDIYLGIALRSRLVNRCTGLLMFKDKYLFYTNKRMFATNLVQAHFDELYQNLSISRETIRIHDACMAGSGQADEPAMGGTSTGKETKPVTLPPSSNV